MFDFTKLESAKLACFTQLFSLLLLVTYDAETISLSCLNLEIVRTGLIINCITNVKKL